MKNMKNILGFMPVHYAGDYLKESLLSIRDHINKMLIAYSYKPSQGHSNKTECPDKRDDIYTICREILGEKLIWDETTEYPSEAHHRSVAHHYAPGFDAILSVDSDEIMIGVPQALEYAFTHEERYFGINGYINLFRSFEWACYDGFRPVRIEVMGRKNVLQNLECPLTIFHFSCAQRKEIMEYKYQNFGHASEIKPGYLENVFYKWSPDNNISDLHCVAIGLWNAVKFDKTRMPEYMKDHKNYNLLLIP